MKTEFAITSTLGFPDGTTVLGGSISGPRLTVGRRGRTTTALGEVEVEILSISLNNLAIVDPNFQSVQVKLIKGSDPSLKGITLTFD